jgi:hypothetical protein
MLEFVALSNRVVEKEKENDESMEQSPPTPTWAGRETHSPSLSSFIF